MDEKVTDTVTKTATHTTDVLRDTITSLMQQAIAWAPKAFAAILVMVVGYIVARIAARFVTGVSEKLGLQKAAENSGFAQSMSHVGVHRTVPQVLGTIVFWLLICVMLLASMNVLGLKAGAELADKVVSFIPNLLVATIVVVLGLLLAAFLRGVIATSADRIGLHYANQLAAACYWVLAIMTFVTAAQHMNFTFPLLNQATLIILGGASLAFGLSFGLGGKEVMAGILSGYYVRQRLQTGDRVTVAGYQGRVREVGPVATIIETEEEGMIYRHSVPNARMLNEAVR